MSTTTPSADNNTRSATRYWCHICNAEVNIYMAPDPTCQQCNEQFIEELHSDDDPREFLSGANTQQGQGEAGYQHEFHLPDGGSAHIFSYSPSTGRLNNLGGSGNNNEMGDDIFQYFTPRTAPTGGEEGAEGRGGENPGSPLGNFVQNLLTNMLGAGVDINPAAGQGGEGGEGGTRPMMLYGTMVDGNMRFRSMPPGSNMPGSMPAEGNEEGDATGTETPGEGERREGAGGTRGNNIASILQFLSAMTGAPLDAGLVGNPNDYVFSQTALDNIITQLMEQTGGASAPPPAPEQVIEALTKRELTDKEKSKETDCAVCKDQFENHEQVIELPCEHIFHDDCIKPWLKLNSTCPVCRHSVLPEGEGETSNNNDNNNNSSRDSSSTNNNNSSNNNNTQQNTNTTSDADAGQPGSQGGQGGQAGGNTRTATATFSWVGGSGNNGQQGQASFPLNLSAAFPSWVNHLSGGNRPSSTSTTTNTTTTTPNSATSPQQQQQATTTQTRTHPMEEDLDLD